jgi:hypothetical protein
MRKSSHSHNDDVRPLYDFAKMKGGVRGKYLERLRQGSNVVLLDPDVARAFPNEAAVNQTLRGVLHTTPAARSSGGLGDQLVGSPSRRLKKSR